MEFCLRPPETWEFDLYFYFECLIVDSIHSLRSYKRKERQRRVVDFVQYGLYDCRYYRVYLHWEVFFRGTAWRRVFERLGDVSVGEQLYHAAQDASLRLPWMSKLVDWTALPRVMVQPRYIPGPTPNWFSYQLLNEAGPFGNETRMVQKWMAQNLTCDNQGNYHAATKHVLHNISLRAWVMGELHHWPIGMRGLMRITARVWKILHNDETFDIRYATTETELETAQETKYAQLLHIIGERHDTMLDMLPPWGRAEGQPDASWEEQQVAMKTLQEHFEPLRYICSQPMSSRDLVEGLPMIRPLYITGPPGTAKTYILQQFARWLSQSGIFVDEQWEITSVGAMRAAVLGGTHVHELFGYVPKEGNQYQTAQALAVTSESRFRRSPWLRRRLQNLMVLLIDELGQLGAELLMALDIVLKKDAAMMLHLVACLSLLWEIIIRMLPSACARHICRYSCVLISRSSTYTSYSEHTGMRTFNGLSIAHVCHE